MRILRRFELRSIDLAGRNEHVSWHVTVKAAHWRMLRLREELYWNDGERWGDGTRYYVRRVGD